MHLFATKSVNLKRLIYFSNTTFLLKIWCSGGLLWTGWFTFGFSKKWGIFFTNWV